MYLKKFGEYLNERNIISSAQLDDIIYSQLENKLMIAQLALSSGFMSQNNINRVLDEQIDHHFRFTEHCVSKGLMTAQQVNQLLFLQSQNHNILCETLCNQNILSREDLSFHLNHFKQQTLDHNFSDIDPSIIDNAPLLKLISGQLRSFLFNEGYVTSIESVETEFIPIPKHIDFATQIQLDRNTNCYLCVRLNEFIVSNIAASRQYAYSRILNPSKFFDLFTEIMFCLTYRITARLRKLGHRVKHGAAQAYLPDYQQCVVLNCNTILDPIEIAVAA